MAVFDNAILFSVAWFKGRGNKGRKDYTDLEAAIADCRSNDRSVIYAATATGRFFCLTDQTLGSHSRNHKKPKGEAE